MKAIYLFSCLFFLGFFSTKSIATELNIAINDRFAAGSYGDSLENMFVSYPYSSEWDGKLSCGVNLWVDSSAVDTLFSKDHDGQFFYLAKSDLNIPMVKFDSTLAPFFGEECVEYSESSESNDPNDTYCIRTRPVFGITSSFTMSFKSNNVSATVACSRSGDLADTTITKMDQDLASSLVKRILTIKIK